MQIDLTGRSALVSGGSYGLGRATAIRLAASGANVAVLARRREVLDEAAGLIDAAGPGRGLGIECDVTRPDQLEAAASEALAAFGTIDILVNNAGSSFRRPFAEMSRDDMLGDMDLKLFAAVRLGQLVLPGMQAQKWGRIINVLSAKGKAPGAASAPTTLSRAAGMALTKAMSRELAPDNILVNALCVGLIKSGQWERRRDRDAPGMSAEEFLAPQIAEIPLGRVGEAEEFANIACFLASDAASYITGTAINVDGGTCPVT